MTSSFEFAGLIRSVPNALIGTGVDEATIADAMSVVGLLPKGYRQFLREVGWAMFWGTAVWGLGDGFPYEQSFVEMTLHERTELGLPDDLVAFSNNGAGDLMCFQLMRDGTTSEEVFVHLHETRTTELEAGSFTEWMQTRAEAARRRAT